MTESVQTNPQQPPHPQSAGSPYMPHFTEEYFKEIEKRAYRGARKALFHSMLISLIGMIILWLVVAGVVYYILLPRLMSLLPVNPFNTQQLNPQEIMKQLQQLQQTLPK